jgi:hypothetical protein
MTAWSDFESSFQKYTSEYTMYSEVYILVNSLIAVSVV